MPSAVDRDASAIKEQADALSRSGNYHNAVPLYSQALGHAVDLQLRSTLLANRCLALLKTQQLEAALGDATKAVELRSRWPKAHLRLAQCREALADLPGAIAAYKRALELEPSLDDTVGKALGALELKAARSQLRLALRAHPGAVYGMALHPQALALGALTTRLLATACADGAVRVWCSSTGMLLQTLAGHSDRVTAVEWSPCGRVLASASLDGTARVWELLQGVEQGCAQAAPPAPVGAPCDTQTAAQQGQQGHQAGAGAGATLQLLRPRVVLEGHTGRVSSLAFALLAPPLPASPVSAPPAAGADTNAGGGQGSGGQAVAVMLLVTGSTDCTARLWDVQTGQCLQILKGHGGIITSVSLSPCGRLLATASGDTRCKVWSTLTGACIHDIAWESGGVNLCGFLPSAPLPPAAAAPAAGAAAAVQPGKAGFPGASAAELAAGAHAPAPPQLPPLLLTAHIEPMRREGRILLWDVGVGVELPLRRKKSAAANPAGTSSAAGPARGGKGGGADEGAAGGQAAGVATAGAEDAGEKSGKMAGNGCGEGAPDPPASRGLPDSGSDGDSSSHEKADLMAESGSLDGAGAKQEAAPAVVEDHQQQQHPAPAAPALGAAEPARPAAAAAAPCRKLVGWVDGKLHAPAQTIDGFRGKITSWDACVGPGGTVLLAAACGDGLARVYDVTRAATGEIKGVAQMFELDMEESMLSAAQQDVPAWSRASMQEAANARNLVRFSPDGRLLAVSGSDRRVGIYDVESSEKMRSMLGHAGSVRAMVWAAAGELVSAGEEGGVKFWRVGP